MMEAIRNHPLATAVAAAGVIAIVVGGFILSSRGPGSGSQNTPGKVVNPQQSTTFYGVLAEASDSFLINYGGSAEPNYDAVHQQFRIMALSSMPLPSGAVALIPEMLKEGLRKVLIPTYATTWIQIDKSTINCKFQYDCRFSFYVDSPESYFDFHLYYQPNGTVTYSLKQQPLPGVSQ